MITEDHQWLHRMLGDWDAEMSCVMEPGQPPILTTGRDTTRSLGGLWVLSEGTAEMPGGGTAQSLMTIGYDPAKGCYVGSFVASMMTHLWTYQGRREGDVLTLDAEGPGMDGKPGRFQDVITLTADGGRITTSRCQMPDGSWQQFMQGRYRRR